MAAKTKDYSGASRESECSREGNTRNTSVAEQTTTAIKILSDLISLAIAADKSYQEPRQKSLITHRMAISTTAATLAQLGQAELFEQLLRVESDLKGVEMRLKDGRPEHVPYLLQIIKLAKEIVFKYSPSPLSIRTQTVKARFKRMRSDLDEIQKFYLSGENKWNMNERSDVGLDLIKRQEKNIQRCSERLWELSLYRKSLAPSVITGSPWRDISDLEDMVFALEQAFGLARYYSRLRDSLSPQTDLLGDDVSEYTKSVADFVAQLHKVCTNFQLLIH